MFHTKFNETTKLWSGADIPPIFNTNISMGHIVLELMRLHGSKIAQIDFETGTSLTFKDIRMKTIQAAQNLTDRGYKSKQVFGIVAENSDYLAPIVYAAFCMACPVNALSCYVGKSDVVRMFGITEPSVVFCDVEVYDLINECLIELGNKAEMFTLNGTKGDSQPVKNLFKETGTEEWFIPTQVDADNDIITIMCSSGTTGESKGVCLSHASMITQMATFQIATTDDIFFSFSSLNWMIGFVATLLNIFTGATRIITSKPFSPELQSRIIKEHQVTVVAGQSYFVIETLKSGIMCKEDFSSVKHMVLAGYKLPFSLIEQFNSYLPNGTINHSYGLTETSGFVTADYPKFSHTDSVGQLLNDYSFKIVDNDGNRCGIDTDGEICIKSPHRFLGYYKNPELSAKAFDSEGFFLSGDIGHVDANGNLYIVDRKKDVILWHYTVLPSEIEAFLIKLPDIKGACVVGAVDERFIELPAAAIVLADDSKITEKDIYKMVEENMPDYCKLRGGVYFIDSIPITPSGKVLRRIVRQTVNELFKTRSKQQTVDSEIN